MKKLLPLDTVGMAHHYLLHLALTRGLQIVQFVKIVQIMKIVQIVKILQQSGGRLQAAYFDNRLKSAKTLCSYLHLI